MNPNLFIDYTMHYDLHTQAHKVNIFLKGTHLHTQAHKTNIFFGKKLSIRKYFICINNSCFDYYAMSSQLIRTLSFICVFVKNYRIVA
jgi:hypothetical protein